MTPVRGRAANETASGRAATEEGSRGRTQKQEIEAEFNRLVNMKPAALRRWLASEASRSVGMKPGGGKVTQSGQGSSVGHHMGERILEIRATKAAERNDDDVADMRKVVGYINRHLKQRPQGDVSDTRWRKSLMNWGHDPEA